MKIRQILLVLVVIFSLGLAACTRSASQSPTQVPGDSSGEQPGNNQNGEQQPPANMETAVAGGEFATQTAAASGAGQQSEQPGGEATEPPQATEAPTAEPPQATEAPSAESPTSEPTAEPPSQSESGSSGGSCESPYTVSRGEWVWSIGRKCNISPQAIISANNLACYYDLAGRLQCPVYPGDTLMLPDNAPPFTGP